MRPFGIFGEALQAVARSGFGPNHIFMDITLLVIAVGAIAGGFVQGLSGFAFGLVAMSFWAWVVDPVLAAAMSVFGGLTGQIVAALSVRRTFQIRLIGPYLIGGAAGLPLGIAILPLLDIYVFRAFLGTILVVWCPLMLFSRMLPRLDISSRLPDGLVGMIGGVVSPLGGYNGVVLSIWGSLRGLEKHDQRSVIQNFNLGMLAATMASYLLSGTVTASMWPSFAIVAPAMLIPTFIGTRVYLGISEAVFRQIVLSLLMASGLVLLGSALPNLLARF